MAGRDGKKPKKAKRKKRGIGKIIDKLDVSSLHEDDITDIMLHCASALAVRRGKGSAKKSSDSASYCYTKSGSSSIVSLYRDGFKVDETTEDDAKARGIPPCG